MRIEAGQELRQSLGRELCGGRRVARGRSRRTRTMPDDTRVELAEDRTDYAEDRTLLAAQRTYGDRKSVV